MVFMLHENQAARVFDRYKDVAAFSLGKKKGYSENGLEINYGQLEGLLPDTDIINGVVSGDIPAKTPIKQAVKALRQPHKEDNELLCIAMTMIINMVDPEKVARKKNKKQTMTPAVVVFVYDDECVADANGEARIKFLRKYLSALFGEFGLEVFTSTKLVKKLFKGKRKDVLKKVAHYKSHKGASVSSKGAALKKLLLHYYAIELHQTVLSKVNIEDMSGRDVVNLVHDLIYAYTNDNLRVSAAFDKKKDRKKICKLMRAKNKAAVDAYNDLRNILQLMKLPEVKKMPKAKSGYKGKKKDKYKMDVEKFEKFFTKNRNRTILALVYAHTAAMITHLSSASYGKRITKTLRDTGIDAKEFLAAAKTYAGEA